MVGTCVDFFGRVRRWRIFSTSKGILNWSMAPPCIKRASAHHPQKSFQCYMNSSFKAWFLQLAGAPWGWQVQRGLKKDILQSPPSSFPLQADGQGEVLSLLI